MPKKSNRLAIVGGVALGVVTLAFVTGRQAQAAARAVNPLNPDNVIAGAVDSTIAGITQDPDSTLGGVIFDAVGPRPGEVEAPAANPISRGLRRLGSTIGIGLFNLLNPEKS